MGHKITRSQLIQEVILLEPTAEFPIDEFEKYKLICLEEDKIPAPSETEQLVYVSYIDTIGRDKYMVYPIDARAEELHHTHMWQEGCSWGEGEELKIQWACTSNSYVVYSYFIDNDEDHHIHVIDYCRDEAHSKIKNINQVKVWTEQAKLYRENRLNKRT